MMLKHTTSESSLATENSLRPLGQTDKGLYTQQPMVTPTSTPTPLFGNTATLDPQKNINMCPNCFKPLKMKFVCTKQPFIYACILTSILLCWAPLVLDACKERHIYCGTCGKVVKIYRAGPQKCCPCC